MNPSKVREFIERVEAFRDEVNYFALDCKFPGFRDNVKQHELKILNEKLLTMENALIKCFKVENKIVDRNLKLHLI